MSITTPWNITQVEEHEEKDNLEMTKKDEEIARASK
jgi:hypothetical protein